MRGFFGFALRKFFGYRSSFIRSSAEGHAARETTAGHARIFVGSSSEGRAAAEIIAAVLEAAGMRPLIWSSFFKTRETRRCRSLTDK